MCVCFNPLAASNASHLDYPLIINSAVGMKASRNVHVCEVEHTTFTPLVMFASGGFSHEASIFYKLLTFLLATK